MPKLGRFKPGVSYPIPKVNNIREQMVWDRFDKLYQEWNAAKGDREGIHVSSVIKSETEFCIRQMVLMQYHQQEPLPLHGRTLRIFAQGWAIHQKWQALFVAGGIAEEVETTHYHEGTGASYTPDAIIRIGKRCYIVEIKSMNAAAYNSMKSVHQDARIQANVYMYLTGIRQAIILVENKDDQEYKLWIIDYEPNVVRPFVKRFGMIQAYLSLYERENRLPKRHIRCPLEATPKAKSCPVRAACFAGKFDRQRLARAYSLSKGLSTPYPSV